MHNTGIETDDSLYPTDIYNTIPICFNLNMLGHCTISKEGNPAQGFARKIKYFTLNSKIKNK